jgi:signal transduction histidine kinase
MERVTPRQILARLAEFFSARYRFGVEWALQGDETLANGRERLIYRCVRELLFNSFKHSQAHSASVLLHVHAREIQITVCDQGIGFDTLSQAQDDRLRFGLASLGERVALAGGRVETHSAIGKGCRVNVHLPLAEAS